MTARKQLSNKARVLRKHPGAYAYKGPSGDWHVKDGFSTNNLASAPTPALAWAAATRVM